MIVLRRCDPAKRMARFYALSLQRSLFGETMLIRRWGRIGVHGQVGNDADGLATRFLDLGDDLLDARGIDVDHADGGTFLCEPQSARAPHAGCRRTDDADFVFHTHVADLR